MGKKKNKKINFIFLKKSKSKMAMANKERMKLAITHVPRLDKLKLLMTTIIVNK